MGKSLFTMIIDINRSHCVVRKSVAKFKNKSQGQKRPVSQETKACEYVKLLTWVNLLVRRLVLQWVVIKVDVHLNSTPTHNKIHSL